jgi:predicted RNA-binding protein with PUA-like domain
MRKGRRSSVAHWILKTEPSTYSFADLVKARRTTWDGVSNPVALRHLREMAVGDDVLIYHTGDEKAVVGLARVTRAAFPDPTALDPKLVVVEVEAGQALGRPVTLKAIKADPAFAELALVRQGRLSVVPVPAPQWSRLLGMAKG